MRSTYRKDHGQSYQFKLRTSERRRLRGNWGARREIESAKLLVVNGPIQHGKGISRGKALFDGRMQTGTEGEATVTVDRLFSTKPSSREPFEFTHVAEIRFATAQHRDSFDAIAKNLFLTLSLMRGGWVGLAGPWFYVGDLLLTISPRVTKASRNPAGYNWCHDSVSGTFDELFSCLESAYADTERGESLQTAIHWLIESQQCAGGVEGAIVLEQAALESLAWFEIVQHRNLCSTSGFEKLPASDKIRWLLSLHSIPSNIPAHCHDLIGYSKACNDINDLPDILVHVRNALVHGSPKNVRRLFERRRGSDERISLWNLATGLLEQAVLAVCGYQGPILRRDVETDFAVSAVKPAPWCTGGDDKTD